MKSIKRGLLKLARAAGYDLIRIDPAPRGFNATHLATVASPRTVIDVGVASGTPALYDAFPQALLILVEPLSEYTTDIERISSTRPCRIYTNAVGSSPGTVELTVDLEDPEKSSLQVRTPRGARERKVERRLVEVITLDTLLRDNPDLPRPILLKLDTEGQELEALRGAKQLLSATDAVIAEVSVARRFEGGYEFEQLLLYMYEEGFRLVDILTISHAKGELEPRHMDVLFMPRSRVAALSDPAS